jgi:hypothetical protein
VDDSSGVDVLETLGDLIGYVLDVVYVQGFGVELDHAHQILGAVLCNQVQLIEIFGVNWSHDGLQFHNLKNLSIKD